MDMIEGHVAVPPPDGISVWDVDPFADEVLLDPMGFFDELRARGPFVYLSRYAMLAATRRPARCSPTGSASCRRAGSG